MYEWESTWREPPERPSVGEYVQAVTRCKATLAEKTVEGFVSSMDDDGKGGIAGHDGGGWAVIRWRRRIWLDGDEATEQREREAEPA